MALSEKRWAWRFSLLRQLFQYRVLSAAQLFPKYRAVGDAREDH
jgi:hypothetical protein